MESHGRDTGRQAARATRSLPTIAFCTLLVEFSADSRLSLRLFLHLFVAEPPVEPVLRGSATSLTRRCVAQPVFPSLFSMSQPVSSEYGRAVLSAACAKALGLPDMAALGG